MVNESSGMSHSTVFHISRCKDTKYNCGLQVFGIEILDFNISHISHNEQKREATWEPKREGK